MAFPAAAGYGNLPNGVFSPTIFSQKALLAFRKVSVVEAITNRDYFGEISNHGDAVKVILEPDVTVSPYVRGQQVNPTDLIDTDITLIVDKANKFAFKVDDIEAKQSHLNWTALATNRAAYKLKDAYDSEVIAYKVGQAGITAGLGTTASPLAIRNNPPAGGLSPLNAMARANRLMDEANVPTDGRFWVAPPQFWELMQAEESRLMQVNQTGDAKSQMRTGLWNGRVVEGDIRGFSSYLSNNLPVGGTGPTATSGANYGTILFGHISATATASQIAKTETFRDPDSFADVVRGLHLYGRRTIRPEALGRIYYNFGS